MQSTYNEEIRQEMKRKGVTQTDLAIACGVHRVTVWGWLRAPLSVDHRKRIETALAHLGQKEGVS